MELAVLDESKLLLQMVKLIVEVLAGPVIEHVAQPKEHSLASAEFPGSTAKLDRSVLLAMDGVKLLVYEVETCRLCRGEKVENFEK